MQSCVVTPTIEKKEQSFRGLRRSASVPVSDTDYSLLLPAPENVVDDVRAELEALASTDGLEPMHIGWAVEQLVESGVELPLVMATIFDFAKVEWLGPPKPQEPIPVDFDALAALLGIDPTTGKPVTTTRALQTRTARNDEPPSSRTDRRRDFATALGSEGMRQRPLVGWSRAR